MHSPGNHSIHFGKMIEAWQRQLPQLMCPLRFEGGRLFMRHRPERREELQRPDPESPIKEPTGFMFARQRFCEFLAEVFGV